MARLHAGGGGDEEYHRRRIAGYMARELHPRHALGSRVLYVALEGDAVVGYAAGHRTRRYGCDGELEWIFVAREHRGRGMAARLLRLLAGWFVEEGAARVCVDVVPENAVARRFYARHGAADFKPHWMVWNDIAAARGEG